LQHGGDEVVARLARRGDRFVEFGGPGAVLLVRHVLDLLADAEMLKIAADPSMALADKAPDRLGGMRPDAGDHHPRQELVAHRQRDDAGIKMAEGNPPFLGQRAQRVVLVVEQGAEVARLDQEAVGLRRREDGGAQFRQAGDRAFRGGRDFRMPGGIEEPDAEQLDPPRQQLLLGGEQGRQFDVARVQLDLDDRLANDL